MNKSAVIILGILAAIIAASFFHHPKPAAPVLPVPHIEVPDPWIDPPPQPLTPPADYNRPPPVDGPVSLPKTAKPAHTKAKHHTLATHCTFPGPFVCLIR